MPGVAWASRAARAAGFFNPPGGSRRSARHVRPFNKELVMTRRIAFALLLLPLLAVAAPVPKRKPAFGAFGDFTDPKTKCKAELAKDGTLTVTVPTDQPAVNPDKMKPLP